jgi:hypothetical protein
MMATVELLIVLRSKKTRALSNNSKNEKESIPKAGELHLLMGNITMQVERLTKERQIPMNNKK